MQYIIIRLSNEDVELDIKLSDCKRECPNDAELISAVFLLAKSLGMESYDEAEVIRNGRQSLYQHVVDVRCNTVPNDTAGIHTCHDDCPCHTGGKPAGDFEGECSLIASRKRMQTT